MHCPLLFVYGTLRRNTGKKMPGLLAGYSDFIGYATFQGKLYEIDDYPGATPSGCPSDLVHGEVYHLREPDFLLPRLDEYEECGLGHPEPAEYSRELREVRLICGKAVAAWIYLYNRPTDKLKLMPSGDFIHLENH
ncbi:hypothetical protein MGMO_124c00220 [Methyloglobulus morosus KoM1]|uniref:Gamma-glutamylcyclotransferase AIG2-like domain-containing protein n=1 Tax=Methyloglobulus morosus KoM1 TaxID=1116472 RepID=V5DSB8_9GAMM|nr:gamma-glutamylcyclotransferase family protein [Methyloglobulus morosus]ESS70291.1 hypothetical protein MGMO_124c00220 [Methyloglobulus morosus KoM1]